MLPITHKLLIKSCHLPFSKKVLITYKLSMKRLPLAVSQKDNNNIQVAHEETAACYFSKITITHKLLMKRPPLAIFSKVTITYKLLMKRPSLAILQR